jgi:hypothetical protein
MKGFVENANLFPQRVRIAESIKNRLNLSGYRPPPVIQMLENPSKN